MKKCPLCSTDYPSHHSTCPTDGATLIEVRAWEPGTIIKGKYRILCQLGKGGMGTVYKAEHIGLEEVRALKVMSAALTEDPTFIKRFRREAQAASKLRHVNAVHVDDLDQAEDGSLFIAMDYVDGVSLRQLLDATKEPLPVERALAIARNLAEGLAAAHALGMVHRDIKPANILLARDAQGRDVPKILDFGIVALKASATLTTRGVMLTPPYASPEQWRGTLASELDGRTDLYALGGVLYEMLTGQTPFHAHNDEGWMYQHLNEAPKPPSALRPELANLPGLDKLMLRLLAKNREGRPDSAQAFLHELNLIEAQRYAPAPAPGKASHLWAREGIAAAQSPAVSPTAADNATNAVQAQGTVADRGVREVTYDWSTLARKRARQELVGFFEIWASAIVFCSGLLVGPGYLSNGGFDSEVVQPLSRNRLRNPLWQPCDPGRSYAANARPASRRNRRCNPAGLSRCTLPFE